MGEHLVGLAATLAVIMIVLCMALALGSWLIIIRVIIEAAVLALTMAS